MSTLLLLLFIMPLGVTQDPFDRNNLPRMWEHERTDEVPASQLKTFSTRLGGEVTGIKNHLINAAGVRFKINVLQCKNEAEALKVYRKLDHDGSSPRYRLVDACVVEYHGCRHTGILKATDHALNLDAAGTVHWKVSFPAAPIDSADYMKWNLLFNRLMRYRAQPGDEENIQGIGELCMSFSFGTTLSLRTAACPWGAPEYTFSTPVEKCTKNGEVTTYTFGEHEQILGLPCVQIDAKIPVKAFAAYKPEGILKGMTAETPHWPVGHEKVKKIVDDLLSEDLSSRETLECLHEWVLTHIDFGGKVVGSRYGTLKVIEQGHGHCWDLSDVLITLSRTAGLPARQVMGWVQGMSGHVWAEIHLPDEGWISVDPTVSWLGTTDDYIPFVLSQDGELSYVYWDLPTLEKLELSPK